MEIAESTYSIFPGMFFLDFDNTKKIRNYNLPKPIWREINSSSFNSTILSSQTVCSKMEQILVVGTYTKK
jgi:hypothetical protein